MSDDVFRIFLCRIDGEIEYLDITGAEGDIFTFLIFKIRQMDGDIVQGGVMVEVGNLQIKIGSLAFGIRKEVGGFRAVACQRVVVGQRLVVLSIEKEFLMVNGGVIDTVFGLADHEFDVSG